ncbi:MAG: Unknown protein [uncultured Sulfurovum sp.]|uniref:PpiC domain-containing protein n=1 Tax=uncultured Sulfurovum sp. TaxID=269237 RepID=A0A6S6SU58_9BACT|nr:MAG: Unknown protein [uncultured Sulfurovum sp.]
MLKRLLYEPLLHFLILGGLLFLFYALSQEDGIDENTISISKERIEQLVTDSEKELLSILTAQEKQKMIDKEVYQAILYNEALKTGLDKNDIDMRNHLVSKMEFLIYDTYELPRPSDEVLKAFMLANPDDYREEPKISFTQNILASGIEKFEKEYTLTIFEANNIFGRSFSEELFTLKADAAVHKLESDYGVHEIRITNKPTPKLQAFESIKEEVKTDYLNKERAEKNKVIYESLKSEYTIDIEES